MVLLTTQTPSYADVQNCLMLHDENTVAFSALCRPLSRFLETTIILSASMSCAILELSCQWYQLALAWVISVCSTVANGRISLLSKGQIPLHGAPPTSSYLVFGRGTLAGCSLLQGSRSAKVHLQDTNFSSSDGCLGGTLTG